MRCGKNLSKIVLTSALSFYSIACDNYVDYHFDGEIGGERVKFEERHPFMDNDIIVLNVKKADGKLIRYFDTSGQDLKLEKITVTVGRREIVYNSSSEIGKEVLKEGQKQFNAYLEKIKEINRVTALKNMGVSSKLEDTIIP